MGKFLAVVNGATLHCSEGRGASHLRSTAAPSVTVEGRRIATLLDHSPDKNIPPFERCNIRGDHKCVPRLPSPWDAKLDSGASVGVAGILPITGELHCKVGGLITVVDSCQSSMNLGDFRLIAALLRARAKVLQAYQEIAAGGDYISPFEAASFALENLAASMAGLPPGARLSAELFEGLSVVADVLGIVDEREDEHIRKAILDRLKKADAALLERINKERGWSERTEARPLNPPPEEPRAESIIELVPPKEPRTPREPMPRGGVPPGAVPLTPDGKPKKP